MRCLLKRPDRYCERPVIGPLGRHFACVWVHRVPEHPSAPIVIVPDGAIDLQWISDRWRIAGPDRQAQVETIPPGTTIVGFRFQPGSAQAWLGLASELRDRRVPLRDVWGPAAITDALDIPDPLDLSRSVEALETVLLRWSATVAAPDLAMRVAYRMLASGQASETHVVPRLMTELELSERTLRRRFDAAFGYGPKALDRILRFQRYVSLMRGKPWESDARLAAEAGYADQPHLIRECQRLALATPRRIREALSHRSPAEW